MINDEIAYTWCIFFFFLNFQTRQSERKNGAIPGCVDYNNDWKYWSQNHREQKLAARQPFRFHRPSHCILFLFCANNRWALSSPAVSLRRASSRRRVDVIRHCLPLCYCSCASVRSHSYPVTQSSVSCASLAIEPLIKEPTEGFLLAR